ncbi:uncharacterized protein [Hetaerina americana]|uniref:uncharacterized protein n=1 Tax=Hetaerina americana TaxID=62018 RepID=UPI003A7F5D00
MLSAFYDYTIARVKSFFGIEVDSRKRRIDETEIPESSNAKIRRIDKPLGDNNCSNSICRNLPVMSNLDRSHHVLRREFPDEVFSWEKKNIGKENQFNSKSRCQESNADVIVIEDDPNDNSHLKPFSHSFRKLEGAFGKDQVLEQQQVRRKTKSSHNKEVLLVDDDEDVIFVKNASKPQEKMVHVPWTKPIQFTDRISDYTQPSSIDTQRNFNESRYRPSGSLFCAEQQFPSLQTNSDYTDVWKKSPSVSKLDSPSVKGRIRAGTLSRAAILKKSLPPPPMYFGVEPKLCPRWKGLDDKIKKKPSALALCSAIDEMKAYSHMLQQFTSETASKQMNTQFDSQAFKLFESQLKRNYSYSRLLKRKEGVESSQVVETVDLSDEDVQEVGRLDEARGPIPPKKKPSNDSIEILPSRKDDDVIQILPMKVDVQRTRERVPKASRERVEDDVKPSWTPPNAVEQMITKSPVTDDQYIKNIVEKFTDERAKIGKELEKEHLIKKLWSERRHKFEVSLEDRLKKYMKITDIVLEDKEIVEEEEELPELTQEMLDIVHNALQKGRGCVLARLGANVITGADIQTLADSNWLNDEVINNYMDMLTQRGQSDDYPSVYCFNTFFYPKLNSSGYSSIRRWTKKVDIFQKDMLIVPLHLEIHWALAVVDFRQKTICYYDSMNGRKRNILQALMKYLQDEKSDKKKEKFDSSGWDIKLVHDIPQQRNGYDCGVFACMFAEHLSRGVVSGSKGSSKCRRTYPPFPFSQDNMPYFRKRMIYEILSGKLLQ